ncbi:NAD-dependent epimerase/dehydratase family protein [Curtobacterium sp. 22159]|uniref:NAD-dependent epimerase/dehydratase family protein n=1 Tax=Curtobacterium sp. 22159 TaxID=3453882 RepID=UPI003F82661D
MTLRVLVVGASGFIGSTVSAHLAAAGLRVRRFSRRRRPDSTPGDWYIGDVQDPVAVAGAVEGCDAVVFAASYTGDDAELARGTNTIGAATVFAQAARSGITRSVSVSTTAVYGKPGGIYGTASTVPTAPMSAASRTRLEAEGSALAAGAAVVRPHVVYGAGDRWVVPALARIVRTTGLWPGPPATTVSGIHVHDLAALVTGLVLTGAASGEVLHATSREPVDFRALVDPVLLAAGVEPSPRHASVEAVVEAMGSPALNARRLDLVGAASEHDSSDAWSAAELTAPAPRPLSAADVSWYVETIRAG